MITITNHQGLVMDLPVEPSMSRPNKIPPNVNPPARARWVARDGNGKWHWYSARPQAAGAGGSYFVFGTKQWVLAPGANWFKPAKDFGNFMSDVPWEETLIEL